jgi:hypothetical protein
MQFFTPDPLFKNGKFTDGIVNDNEGRVMRTSPRKENVAKLLAFSKALEVRHTKSFGSLEFIMN